MDLNYRQKPGFAGKLLPTPLTYRPRRRREAAITHVKLPSLDLRATQACIISSLQRSCSEKKLISTAVRKPEHTLTSITLLSTDTDQPKLLHKRSSSTLFPSVPLPSLPLFPCQQSDTIPTIDRKERCRKALTALKHFKQLSLAPHTILYLRQYVPSQPFTDKQSLRFLMACRLGETSLVEDLLLQNRWLALEFDKVRKTGLHWAARRNHMEIIAILLQTGAFIDARDCLGRTPLFLASRASNIPAVRLLLSNKANPFLKASGQKAALSVSKDIVIQQLLTRAMQLHLLLKFAEVTKRRRVWEQEGLAFFTKSLAH